MEKFLQMVVSGISSGSIYALAGLGIGMVFNVSRVINLAQGEFLTWGALLTIALLAIKLPIYISIPIAIASSIVMGLLFERFVIHPAWNSTPTVLLMSTVAFSSILKGVYMLGWGKDLLSIPSFSGEKPLNFGGLIIPTQVFWVVGALVLVAGLSWYFFTRTLTGKGIIAVAENRDAAALVGVNVRRAVQISFALSAAVGAIAGAVVAPITFVVYDGGTMIGLKGFIALTLGGMESMWGGFVGGIILGLLEALGAGFISAEYKDSIAFIILIIFLYVRPTGILGRKRV